MSENKSTYTTTNCVINTDDNIDTEFQDRVKKYLRLSKQTLAEMLAIRDENDENKLVNNPDGTSPYIPPYKDFIDNINWCPYTTSGRCTNPLHNCINCPGYGVTVTYNDYGDVSSTYSNCCCNTKDDGNKNN